MTHHYTQFSRDSAPRTSTRPMRTRHLFICPRGFANETTIYRITTPDGLKVAQRLLQEYHSDQSGSARFVTGSEAEAHCRSNRRQARQQERGGMNLYQNPVGAREIIDIESSIEH